MYSWNPIEALDLLGIKVNTNKKEVYIGCPFCGSKRFAFNTAKGIGQCWSCEKSADSAKYYATVMGLSLADARKDIEMRLGIEVRNNEIKRTLPPRIVYNTKEEEAKKASDDVLDKTYRAFLSELTLSEKNRAMLQARGMSDEEITVREYKTFPNRSNVDFYKLCKRLQLDGNVLEGVPGFYKTKTGDFTFLQLTQGIIMPQKNVKDQITGLQIRKDDDLRNYIEELGDYEAKCAWFSSKNRNCGCGANANVHYACDFKYNGTQWVPVFEDGFALTEGIMKADITHYLQPNLPVIAVPGVHALESLKIELQTLKEIGVKTILLCYDMDYHTNPNVQKALDKTKALIEATGLRCKPLDWETKVTINGEVRDVLKGIDDYLAYCSLGIVPEVKKKGGHADEK